MKRLFAVLLMCCALQAQAHRFHAGITEISFNAQTGNTEVVHTLMAHDVEALLANLYQRQFDLSQPEDEAVLRKYVEKQFVLKGADGRALALEWVGVSIDTENLVIYQQLGGKPMTAIARVRDAVLLDFIGDQSNTLNLNENGRIRSLQFDAKTAELPLR